jgi:pimeloyl-ACP methyl ester carboxylesterase
MATKFTTSEDGSRIAYDCSGNGPPILLVHGGGRNRQEWHEAG